MKKNVTVQECDVCENVRLVTQGACSHRESYIRAFLLKKLFNSNYSQFVTCKKERACISFALPQVLNTITDVTCYDVDMIVIVLSSVVTAPHDYNYQEVSTGDKGMT